MLFDIPDWNCRCALKTDPYPDCHKFEWAPWCHRPKPKSLFDLLDDNNDIWNRRRQKTNSRSLSNWVWIWNCHSFCFPPSFPLWDCVFRLWQDCGLLDWSWSSDFVGNPLDLSCWKCFDFVFERFHNVEKMIESWREITSMKSKKWMRILSVCHSASRNWIIIQPWEKI